MLNYQRVAALRCPEQYLLSSPTALQILSSAISLSASRSQPIPMPRRPFGMMELCHHDKCQNHDNVITGNVQFIPGSLGPWSGWLQLLSPMWPLRYQTIRIIWFRSIYIMNLRPEEYIIQANRNHLQRTT